MSTIVSKIYEMTAPYDLKVREEEIDTYHIEDDHVVAKTICSVVSPGTEVAAYIGSPPLRPMKVYPRVNGYCNIAEVVAIGNGVEEIRIGDRISTHQSHRSAFICHQNRINSVLKDGDNAIEHASLYLWHLGYYPLIRSGIKPGANVLVVGLGTLGLTAVAASNLAGCNTIAISDQEWACNKANVFGASSTSCRKDINELNNWVSEKTLGIGVDLVVLTSNSWGDWQLSMELVRDGGTIAIVGFPGRGVGTPDFNPLDSRYIYDKELSILACGNPPACDVPPRELRFTLKRNYTYLDEMIRQKRLPAKEIISEEVHWTELESLYKRMESREPNLLTAVLQW